MNKPDGAGIYRFKGRRQYSKRNDYIAVDTVVEVRPYMWGKEPRFAVYFFGRSDSHRPELFSGEWVKIEWEAL